MAAILLGAALGLFQLAACAQDPADYRPRRQVALERLASDRVRIVLRWPGDEFASGEELVFRNRIATRLSERGLGRVLRSGTGMGWAELVVERPAGDEALRAVEGLVGELAAEEGWAVVGQ